MNARTLLKGTIQFLNKKMYPYGWKLKILFSPLEYWMPKMFMMPQLGYPAALAKTKQLLSHFSMGLCKGRH